MRGVTCKSPESIARARALRAEGLTFREIGERLGVSLRTAHDWLDDPDGAKLRARKDSYAGTCVDCGSPTSGGEGRRTGPRCLPCAAKRNARWSREAIITAINEWADESGGIPPIATDWNPAHPRATAEQARKFRAADGRWPWIGSVQHYFGSWANAIEAAGFERPRTGHYGRPGEDPAFVAEIVRLYRTGLSLAAVGEVVGMSEYGVQYLLKKAGEPRRPPHRRFKAAA